MVQFTVTSFRVVTQLRLFPYSWDHSASRLNLCSSAAYTWWLISGFLSNSFHICYCGYIIYQHWKSGQDVQEGSPAYIRFVAGLCARCIFGALSAWYWGCMLQCWVKRKEMLALLNRVLEYRVHLADNGFTLRSDTKLGPYLFIVAGPRVVMDCIGAFRSPNRFLYYYNALPFAYRGTASQFLLGMCFLFVNATRFAAFVFILYVMHMTLETIEAELKQRKQGKDTTKGTFSTVSCRQWQVIITLFNDCFASVMWPLFTLCISSIQVLGAYCAIKLFGKVPLSIYFNFPVMLFISFNLFIRSGIPGMRILLMWEEIAKTAYLDLWKTIPDPFVQNLSIEGKVRHNRAMVITLRPIRIRIGSYLSIDRTFCIAYISAVLYYTVNMLVNF